MASRALGRSKQKTPKLSILALCTLAVAVAVGANCLTWIIWVHLLRILVLAANNWALFTIIFTLNTQLKNNDNNNKKASTDIQKTLQKKLFHGFKALLYTCINIYPFVYLHEYILTSLVFAVEVDEAVLCSWTSRKCT